MHLSRDEAAAARRAEWLRTLEQALAEAHSVLERLTLGDVGLLGAHIAAARAQVARLRTVGEPESLTLDLGRWFTPAPPEQCSQPLR